MRSRLRSTRERAGATIALSPKRNPTMRETALARVGGVPGIARNAQRFVRKS
jgi:hypothetical protein